MSGISPVSGAEGNAGNNPSVANLLNDIASLLDGGSSGSGGASGTGNTGTNRDMSKLMSDLASMVGGGNQGAKGAHHRHGGEGQSGGMDGMSGAGGANGIGGANGMGGTGNTNADMQKFLQDLVALLQDQDGDDSPSPSSSSPSSSPMSNFASGTGGGGGGGSGAPASIGSPSAPASGPASGPASPGSPAAANGSSPTGGATPVSGSSSAAPQGLSTAPQTTANSPAQSKQVADAYVANLQKDFGLTKDQAAGIVANLWHESGGMNSGINQGGAIGAPSSNLADDNANGYGIAQWGGSRKQGLIDYAQQHGLDPSSQAANYGYLKQELETSQSGAIAAVKATNSPQAATEAFSNAFEHPSDPEMQSRLADLNQVLA
ncbi:MAG TPA: phage tail tip lysozyme [Paraburkholderia sp.]|nr:phage tail tip lysozyme [Paraburkholderia sp.]